MSRVTTSLRKKVITMLLATVSSGLVACADAEGPKARDVNIPSPQSAEVRKKAVNERPDAVMYLPLGKDVLVPMAENDAPLPSTVVGPFELRGETLAGALQLILDGTNIPVAFESNQGLDKTITVTNLKGPLDSVVSQVCSLADLYCSYQNGILTVKDTQIFTVTIPPIVSAENTAALLTNIAAAVGSITGETPVTDASTRTIVYKARQRTAELASRYFQRLRSNTALIVYETYIWEVSLNAGNSTGIRWSALDQFKKFNVGINLAGSAGTTLGTPISIGLPTTGNTNFDTGDVLQFISDYGAVKTISQPQVTVLAGSTAKLRVSDRQNYVASVSRTTTDGGNTTVSTTTDHVDSGFTLTIGSNWDNATVYGNVNILLQEVRAIDTFSDNPQAVVQLPQTTERELQTQVRVRPGDSVLIAGLVKENDTLNRNGPGLNEPIIPTSRKAQSKNSELVFLLRPRVVVFTANDGSAPRDGVTAPAAPIAPVAMNVQDALKPQASEMETPAGPVASAPDVKPEAKKAPELPEAPVTTIEPAPSASASDKREDKVENNKLSSKVEEVPLADAPFAAGSPVALAGAPVDALPESSSVEVAPLSEASAPATPQSVMRAKKDDAPVPGQSTAASSNPSVIVNYDILGR